MRTDTQTKGTSETLVDVSCGSSGESKETMKVVRKSLHPLQIAAGDKENLVGAGRMLPLSSDKDPKAALSSSSHSYVSPKKDKKKLNKILDKKPVIKEEELTSEDGPSENYWQLLAETRRKALENALVENEKLHERLRQLEDENNTCKNLINEAQGIIDTLNEIIGEMNNDDNSGVEEEIIRRP